MATLDDYDDINEAATFGIAGAGGHKRVPKGVPVGDDGWPI